MEQPDDLAIGSKIALIGASFLLPIAVLLLLLMNSMSGNIEFAEKELVGNALLRQLMGFQNAAQDYREASPCAAVAQDHCHAARDTAKAVGDSILGVLHREIASTGGNRSAPDLEAAWRAFTGSDPARPEFHTAHSKVSELIRAIIAQVGDSSNLNFDPDLDSHYLMDAVLHAGPQMQDRLTAIAAIGKEPKFGETERRKLAVAASLLEESDWARVLESSKRAIREDPRFHGSSPTLQLRLEASIAGVAEPVARLLEAMRNGGTGETVARLASETRRANFIYWTQANEELDVLLRAKILSHRQQRAAAMVISSVAIVAAAFVAFLILRSITRPLERVVESLHPGAGLLSGCAEKVAGLTQQEQPSPEQAILICDELNAHAEDMRRAVWELARQVRGPEVPARAEQKDQEPVQH